jgi:4-methyl-5(b-hydroxyethyl)-thiazole monophosphate biosynthesis
VVAAICAAPKVLAQEGLLDGKRATAYPGCVDWEAYPQATNTGGAVEVDGNVITSRGPGTAMDFALALVEHLQGRAARLDVEARLVREPVSA